MFTVGIYISVPAAVHPKLLFAVIFLIVLVPTALVPLPISNAPDVKVVTPVPPAATGMVPAVSTPFVPVYIPLFAAVPIAPALVILP